MIVDKENLKALAEAAATHVSKDDEYRSPGYDKDCWHDDVCDFANAMSPGVVLALLAEIERLESQAASRRSLHAKECVAMTEVQGDLINERDQLKAEVASLVPDFEEVKRLCKALAWLDIAVPSGGEEKAARWVELVSSVVRAAEGSKMLRQDAVEIQALRKDAERYQVLRQADIDTIQNGCLFAGLVPDNLVINGYDLDKRTDAVIASRKAVTP